jgi:ribosomal protein S18 acetylase RimI-like enzyme
MDIRKAVLEDLEILVDFQYKMALGSENLELDRVVLTKGVKNAVIDPNKASVYVAQENGTIIGSLMITLEWSDWRNGWVWWIQSLYVLPEYRQKGVFKQMYNYLQEVVKGRDDVKGIRLYVDQSNFRAQKVYQAIGMCGEHYTTYEWLK